MITFGLVALLTALGNASSPKGVPKDLFVHPQAVVARASRQAVVRPAHSLKKNSRPDKGGAKPLGVQFISSDKDLHDLGAMSLQSDTDRKNRERLIKAVLAGETRTVANLRAVLEKPYTEDGLATDVGVALTLQHRGKEALKWFSPYATLRAEDRSWMLWYSLALAQAGYEMPGQRAYAKRQVYADESDLWMMMPLDSEPNSLIIQSIYSLSVPGNSLMYQSAHNTVLLALKYRPNDPWACVVQGNRALSRRDLPVAKAWFDKAKGRYSPEIQGLVDDRLQVIERKSVGSSG